MDASQDLWVFGYGSLMWQPGFAFDEMHTAVLEGWHRELCIYSHHWRGTKQRPGLVLGLDAGGSCRGVAFRVGAERAQSVRAYLHAREMRGSVYKEVTQKIVILEDGREVEALTYVSDSEHPQYAGNLTREERLAIVEICKGEGGPNRDYVINTVLHLRQLYVRDDELEWLHERLGGEAFNDQMAGI
jgi:glutathione-specific gamma-glutamylcyclotransferase